MSTPSDLLKRYQPSLDKYLELYQAFHAEPELSLCEVKTADRVVQQLSRLAGFEIKSGLGGHGVVGVLRNGPGKTVLLRAELDALPIKEQTNLPYASKYTMPHFNTRVDTPTMHACGHDIHMSAQLAAAEMLHACQEHWSGTLVVLFQSDEENGTGARAMVQEGLYSPQGHAIPYPDVALGGHCMPFRAGEVATRLGVINAMSQSFKVTFYSHGGHGARPHQTSDPLIAACNVVTRLQQIITRRIDPSETAMLTVGSIHAGSSPTIIPSEAVLEVNMRAFSNEVVLLMYKLMREIVMSEALLNGMNTEPTIEQITDFPLLINDEAHTLQVAKSFEQHFGSLFRMDAMKSTGSEDFAALRPEGKELPFVFWNYGFIESRAWDQARESGTVSRIPANHSPFFSPEIRPTLEAGIQAYCLAALVFLAKG